ncbi:Amidohydro-rel domain-containing protein [Mycena kentingensis (nom. inval.)]|nr:Amidohydro-rel domain-containing protein [Mycena kentingensis (nom. inval.)]
MKSPPALYSHLPTRRSLNKANVFKASALLLAAASLSAFLPSLRTNSFSSTPNPTVVEWKDNTWPIREQSPYDISTDYQYPRVLEYDVQEGTWLRLDVSPANGDILFDMLGDLYCIPASEVPAATTGQPATARPVLLGVPHDSDPSFSPSGDRIVFRSDAGLGVENIWVRPWDGCVAADLRNPNGAAALLDALSTKAEDDALLARGVKETEERRTRRLVREGRDAAQRVTNESFRWVSDASFHASGKQLIATKWFTSSRSLGAGEGWLYDIPELGDFKPIAAGSGKRVLERTLPRGWAPEQYGEQQIGPEQILFAGEDTVIYSKNVVDEHTFQYSKDGHKGIYAIFTHNLTSQETKELVSAFPGGASRPEISSDRRTLAFVRRDRDRELLVFKDLKTGTIRNIWDGLSYDLTLISAPMGTYPSFAFTPSGDAVIIWAAGQIYSVPITKNALGESIADPSRSPAPIRFKAHIEKRLAETLTAEFNLVGFETAATQRVTAFKDLSIDGAGKRVVLQAAGVSYVHDLGTKSATRVPVLDKSAAYYSPSWVPGDDFVIHARWSNTNFSSFEVADIMKRKAFEVVGLPLGRYISPVVSKSGRKIAFIKSGGDYMTGEIVATAGAGLYVADISLPGTGEQVEIKNIQLAPSGSGIGSVVGAPVNLRFASEDSILVQSYSSAFVLDLVAGTQTELASGKMSTEITVSSTEAGKGYIGFVDGYNIYAVPAQNVKDPVWAKPKNSPPGLARIGIDGGHDITWSADGKTVLWLLGPYLHSLDVTQLSKCDSEIKADPITYGIDCVQKLLDVQEIVIQYETDIARLKKEAAALNAQSADADAFVIFNATILTMATGDPKQDLIHNGVLTIRGGVIESVGGPETRIQQGVAAYNAQGGFVVPGFVDVHAHWNGFAFLYPSASWELQTFLAYGVTTLHNPSADNVEAFDERFRVESGQIVGSRIFSTGGVIYGAGIPGLHQDIADDKEAESALTRLRVEGGMGSISYKNYNLPVRASRQRLLKAARKLGMLCVPEGGMNFDWNIAYIVDGMTTIEHAIPIPVLYDDVMTLFVESGTGYTPTHIVTYGGPMGEQYVWAHEDLPNDPKLRRFIPHANLNDLVETTSRPDNSFQHFNTSASAAKMVHNGLKVNIGAHGENPLGVLYHAEMSFAKAGGLSNYETLEAATASGAKTLGLWSSIGSLSPGKLADLVVYPPGLNLLEEDISQTRDIRMVARGGRFYDANTLEEVWPVKGRREGEAAAER